jgi:hypothetical protein
MIYVMTEEKDRGLDANGKAIVLQLNTVEGFRDDRESFNSGRFVNLHWPERSFSMSLMPFFHPSVSRALLRIFGILFNIQT